MVSQYVLVKFCCCCGTASLLQLCSCILTSSCCISFLSLFSYRQLFQDILQKSNVQTFLDLDTVTCYSWCSGNAWVALALQLVFHLLLQHLVLSRACFSVRKQHFGIFTILHSTAVSLRNWNSISRHKVSAYTAKQCIQGFTATEQFFLPSAALWGHAM